MQFLSSRVFNLRQCKNSHKKEYVHPGNFMPYSLRTVCGFFNVPHWTLNMEGIDWTLNMEGIVRTRRAYFQMYLESSVKLRDNNEDFNIKWTIISRARPYNNISKRCDPCLTEKLMIITANPDRTLNKRSELISKCRHEKKFYLRKNWPKNNTLLIFSHT